MGNIMCTSFPVEPSEIELAKSLVGYAAGYRAMCVSYWVNEDIYEWQLEDAIGSLFEEEIVLSSIHQIDHAKLLVNLGLDSTTIKGILNA